MSNAVHLLLGELMPMKSCNSLKSFAVILALSTSVVVGQVPATSPANPDAQKYVGEVNVLVSKDGNLWCANGFAVPDSDIASFVTEYVKHCSVMLSPGNDGPDFGTLVKAKDKLEKAGVKSVVFSGASE